MKLERFKEKDNKRIGIILFTIVCILLVSGVILYRTFAIFEVKTNQNVINGTVQDMGDLEFAFYKDNEIVKEVPKKDEGYSLDTSSSYCKDLLNDKQVSTVNWDYDNWEVRIKNISTTKTKCYLYFKKIYQEEELHGAIPDLGNGRLVPIQILDNAKPSDVTEYTNTSSTYGGKVVKANITDEWYSYANQQWANAVILKDDIVDNYSPGQEIPESDIESYFVWIPRYRYEIFNEGNYQDLTANAVNGKVEDASQIVNIVFESKNQSLSTGSTKGSWLTHPAFTSFNSNGFWVGKFETGYLNAQNYEGACSNEKAIDKIIIKPNVFSWTCLQLSNAFEVSFNYIRELDSHLVKSTEWGAVAYLQHSKYGSGDVSVRLNNNTWRITGYAAREEPTVGHYSIAKCTTSDITNCNSYDAIGKNTDGMYGVSYYNPTGVAASTTNNYSGIYDMAGGPAEMVMGVNTNSLVEIYIGKSLDENSGFNGLCIDGNVKNDGVDLPDPKYYDKYAYENANDFSKRILGDALGEIGPFGNNRYLSFDTTSSSWHDDSVTLMSKNAGPWILRGGDSLGGLSSGIFSYSYHTGKSYTYGFRIILTP